MTRKQRLDAIMPILADEYPDARCLLDYGGDPFRLLIATILAAQTTDESVNRVTKTLWPRFPGPAALAAADRTELERIVHPLGFFRNKSRRISEASRHVLERHGGVVPDNMEDLLEIPGTGRKTANVVLGEAFGQPAIIVDTHVKRLSGRIDLSRRTDPDGIERDLMRLVPSADRTDFSHRLGFHGRRVCKARAPACRSCPIAGYCPRRGLES
ncbi:endonuclease III [Candidatus Fermentibacterales bacterium]|nr:endonuclease III [Candidatus Fermentibacterales bacterium]